MTGWVIVRLTTAPPAPGGATATARSLVTRTPLGARVGTCGWASSGTNGWPRFQPAVEVDDDVGGRHREDAHLLAGRDADHDLVGDRRGSRVVDVRHERDRLAAREDGEEAGPVGADRRDVQRRPGCRRRRGGDARDRDGHDPAGTQPTAAEPDAGVDETLGVAKPWKWTPPVFTPGGAWPRARMAARRLIAGYEGLAAPGRRSGAGVAVERNTFSRSPTAPAGAASRARAKAPATYGAAIEVPDFSAKPPPGTDETMRVPGASRLKPVGAASEKLAIWPVVSRAPTEMAPDEHAGNETPSGLEWLPEATVTAMPEPRQVLDGGLDVGVEAGARDREREVAAQAHVDGGEVVVGGLHGDVVEGGEHVGLMGRGAARRSWWRRHARGTARHRAPDAAGTTGAGADGDARHVGAVVAATGRARLGRGHTEGARRPAGAVVGEAGAAVAEAVEPRAGPPGEIGMADVDPRVDDGHCPAGAGDGRQGGAGGGGVRRRRGGPPSTAWRSRSGVTLETSGDAASCWRAASVARTATEGRVA